VAGQYGGVGHVLVHVVQARCGVNDHIPRR
jgi:hypothetical protein